MIKQIYYNPNKEDWEKIQQRPSSDNTEVTIVVQEIMEAVKEKGNKALQFYASKFDQYTNANFSVTPDEIEYAVTNISNELKEAINIAYNNIKKFHQNQIKEEAIVETMPGIMCWRQNKAIQKVGLYIPGGTAPLFSTVLMLGIPAQLVGCEEVILCTPTKADAPIHEAILYAAQLCEIKNIYKLGGASAIAAMTYGTASIPKVFKIFGPGNQYVTAAKQLAQQYNVAIDMPAGPSEACILADETANPSYVAADLLAQAEHGNDSQVMLVCTPQFNIDALQKELNQQLSQLPRKDFASQSLAHSKIIQFETIDTAIDFVNNYAAEHLIICTANEDSVTEQIHTAGSVFIGNYSPESVGDYASGTNHTLPTNGYANQYSGVSIDSFVKKITYQKLTTEGLRNIANTVITMAEAEQLQAHANAVKIRVNSIPTAPRNEGERV
jgi:histidinol dehydrogenase